MTQSDTARIKVKAQVMAGAVIAIGPGKADLLDAVARTGSIAAAGRTLGISYRRTRDMIDILNACWGEPVVETAKGGSSGGGSHLTPRGRAVLDAFRALESALQATTRAHADALLDLLGPAAAAPGAAATARD
jgi:molybdate transport system regulatory protein